MQFSTAALAKLKFCKNLILQNVILFLQKVKRPHCLVKNVTEIKLRALEPVQHLCNKIESRMKPADSINQWFPGTLCDIFQSSQMV